MPNTFTQLYIQIVFAVRGRQSLIVEKHREEIQKYITGIIQNRKHKLLAIYCMPDHIHILIGYKPDQNISKLVQETKAISSKFINEKGWLRGKFNWQEGYGAFSYSPSHLDKVIHYINNQPEHHRAKHFREEYLDLLKEFSIEYRPEYLFEWLE